MELIIKTCININSIKMFLKQKRNISMKQVSVYNWINQYQIVNTRWTSTLYVYSRNWQFSTPRKHQKPHGLLMFSRKSIKWSIWQTLRNINFSFYNSRTTFTTLMKLCLTEQNLVTDILNQNFPTHVTSEHVQLVP